ncbi:ribosomal RNA-processing protein 1 [Monosporozyma unispora]
METSNFVKQLSAVNRPVREKALEALQKFLVSDKIKHSKQLQFDKLWKGLYYAMWFCDKPRPQQRLANKLGELFILYFNEEDNKADTTEELTRNDKAFIKFSKAFWKVLCIEWFNIDRYRLDKFLLLTRRVLFNQIKYLQSRQWSPLLVEKYISKVLKALPLSGDRKVYTGIPLHVTDIFLDEFERLFTNANDEFENDEEKKDETIEEWIKTTPIRDFVAVFQGLQAEILTPKAIRLRIKEDFLPDERLVQWCVVESVTPAAESDDEEAEEEQKKEDEEEWKGF